VDTRLDKIDLAIINSLMQDGRKSFRQIAKEIKISTPTVEARFSKMKGLGIIKNIQPIFDINKIENQISALVFLKSNPSQSITIANKLSSMPEVRSVYMSAGAFDMIAKVIVERPQHLEFMREKIANIEGIRSVSYRLITKTIKEDQSVPIKEGISLKIKCDYCENEIARSAKVMQVGKFERYFCCNSCLILYKQKYKGRIEAASR
jgi:DNA-binding Lrp family transcriptional regulator